MATRTERMLLDFRGGMRRDEERMALANGYAWTLKNWIPEPSGILRPRTGWQSFTGTGNPADRTGNGIGVFEGDSTYLIAHASSSSTFEIYEVPQAGGGANLVDTVATGVGQDRFVKFVEGNGLVLHCTSTYPSNRIRKWNGTTAADAETTGMAGNALSFHKERFWSGGRVSNPTRLYYSSVLDASTWDTTNGYLEVGPDDGEAILDAKPVLGGLLVAKASSLWFVSGDGPSTFSVDRLSGGGGMNGHCICPTPYGAVIAGKPQVWEWRGGKVEKIGDPVVGLLSGETYYPLSGNVTTAYASGKVYIYLSDQQDGWVFDLERRVWYHEAGSGGSEQMWGVGWDATKGLLGFTVNASSGALLGYREVDGGSSLTRTADGNDATDFELRTPDYLMGAGNAPGTLTHLYMAVRRYNFSGTNTFDVSFYAEGSDSAFQTDTITLAANTKVQRFRLDPGGDGIYVPEGPFTGYAIGIKVTQSLALSEVDTMDILAMLLEYEVEKDR